MDTLVPCLAGRELAGARNFRPVRDSLHGPSGFAAHPASGRLGRLSAAQRLSRRGISRRADGPGIQKELCMTTVETATGATKTMVLNMGPQHPSTHGVLRVLLELDGETVVRAVPDLGYLAHRDRKKLRRQDVFAGHHAHRPDGLPQSRWATTSSTALRWKNCWVSKFPSARSIFA